jgi:chemotaxis protein MotB
MIRSKAAVVLGALAACTVACTAACGPSEKQVALERQTRELQGTLAEQRQYNEDLALRLRLAEARGRVLIGLVEGLTETPAGEPAAPSGIAASQTALAGLDSDLNALIATAQSSRADIAATRAQRAQLEQELSAAKQTLNAMEEDRARQAARYDTLIELLTKLDGLIRDRRLALRVVGNRMLLSLPDELLFASNDARVAPKGKQLLDDVAEVLKVASDRELQVAGHSDARPVRYGRYPDNWRLSSERALNVMQYLIERGVARERISAAAYGSTRPIDPAQTEQAARRNRRIEIVLLPKLDELPDHSTLEALLANRERALDGASAPPVAPAPAVSDNPSPP